MPAKCLVNCKLIYFISFEMRYFKKNMIPFAGFKVMDKGLVRGLVGEGTYPF